MSGSVLKRAISSRPLHRLDDAGVVCVIHDDEDVCKALERLRRSIGLAVETFPSPQAFLAYPLADRPSCLVLDVQLPGQSGLELQTALEEAELNIPIVFVTGHGDVPTSVRAMKAGAVDFLPKPFRDQDLLDAVTTAIERDRRRRTVDGDANVLRDRFLTLSPREQQVMMLVTAGKMNKQVAGDLGLSEITVKIHRGSAMRKMGARTLADLVRMADSLKPQAG